MLSCPSLASFLLNLLDSQPHEESRTLLQMVAFQKKGRTFVLHRFEKGESYSPIALCFGMEVLTSKSVDSEPNENIHTEQLMLEFSKVFSAASLCKWTGLGMISDFFSDCALLVSVIVTLPLHIALLRIVLSGLIRQLSRLLGRLNRFHPNRTADRFMKKLLLNSNLHTVEHE